MVKGAVVMKVPKPIWADAKQLQARYAERGIKRDMWELIPEIYEFNKIKKGGRGGFTL